MRKWNEVSIVESNEPLIAISDSIYKIEPHPYIKLGAPYLDKTPWYLRLEVARRLNIAQDLLISVDPTLKLAIFDALRPISVQLFMIEYTIKKECSLRGIRFNSSENSHDFHKVKDEVEMFWAPPSLDPLTPPPHSTGAAVDLTIIDSDGALLDMGSEIDFIGDISRPDYFKIQAQNDIDSKASLFHSRRQLLFNVMNNAGFAQHPTEWWHFSFGDQLWCWTKNLPVAIYGSCEEVNKSITDRAPIFST